MPDLIWVIQGHQQLLVLVPASDDHLSERHLDKEAHSWSNILATPDSSSVPAAAY